MSMHSDTLSWFGANIPVFDVQSVHIITKVVSSNPVHGDAYSIQHYVIKFVSDLRQVSGFHRVLRFPPPIKLTLIRKPPCYSYSQYMLDIAIRKQTQIRDEPSIQTTGGKAETNIVIIAKS
jgi:hypothetical protein